MFYHQSAAATRRSYPPQLPDCPHMTLDDPGYSYGQRPNCPARDLNLFLIVPYKNDTRPRICCIRAKMSICGAFEGNCLFCSSGYNAVSRISLLSLSVSM